MDFINPFDVFSVTEISAAINILPNRYGRINELGIMPVKGVMSSSIAIEEKNGTLALIPTNAARGGPARQNNSGKRKVRTFSVPKLELDDEIKPEHVQFIRAYAQNQQLELLTNLLNDRLGTLRAKHEITLEHLRIGALKGQILDADGSTLYDLYTEFGVVAKTVDFVLGTAGTKVSTKCREVLRHIEDNLKGEVMTGVHSLVSQEFFDKLIVHSSVEAAYANYAAAQQMIGGDNRSGFRFAGITFEEYRGTATDPTTGNARRFIAANEGHAFPLGTIDTFATLVAPADFNETVGQIGQQYYAKVVESKFARGWDVHSQSNPLPMCMRPAVLVKPYSSN